MFVLNNIHNIRLRFIIIFILLLFRILGTHAQNFTNNDLDGPVVAISALPTDWLSVPYSDSNCSATGWINATPDLTDSTGPVVQDGVMGFPYSGNTFLSGLHSTTQSVTFQEGIMQTVSGFSPGCYYTINFYQAVVKQYSHALWDIRDTAGSWVVYLDDNLVGVSKLSVSHEPYQSKSFIWEFRSIEFKAMSTLHTIKFLPLDDDSTYADTPFGGLRMGIDSIYIKAGGLVDLGSDTVLCPGVQLAIDASRPGSTYLWQDGTSSPTLIVNSVGSYWVEVYDGCSVVSDTINVSYSPLFVEDLGNDTSLCPGANLILDATSTNVTYLWQDGSNNPVYNVSSPGIFWVEISDTCSVSDTITIEYDLLPYIELGRDTVLCTGVELVLDAVFNGATYLWQDNSVEPTFTISESGLYNAQITALCGTASDSIQVDFIACECLLCVPDVFTPDGYGVTVNNRLFIFNKLGHTLDGVERISFKVFSRWGEMVFEASTISEIIYPDGGWDGTHRLSGKEVEIGVYAWILIASTNEGVQIGPISGNVTLLR